MGSPAAPARISGVSSHRERVRLGVGPTPPPPASFRGGVPIRRRQPRRRHPRRASRPSGCAARVWAAVGRPPPPACPPTPPPPAWPVWRRALGRRRREGVFFRVVAPRRREPRVRGRPLRLLPPLLRDLFHRVVLLALQLRLLDALRVGAGVSGDGAVEPSLAVVRLSIDDPLGRAELLDALFVLEVRHGEVVEDLLRRGERRELRLSAWFD